PPPLLSRRVRRVQRRLHVRRAGVGYLADRLGRRGAQVRPVLAGDRGDPLAPDVVLVAGIHRDHAVPVSGRRVLHSRPLSLSSEVAGPGSARLGGFPDSISTLGAAPLPYRCRRLAAVGAGQGAGEAASERAFAAACARPADPPGSRSASARQAAASIAPLGPVSQWRSTAGSALLST